MSTSHLNRLRILHPSSFVRTHFEDLSNEVIYEIFDCLEVYHIYEAFHDLNLRFRNLLTCSNQPLHINTSFLNKSNFERYFTDFVVPNMDRISSIHLRNSFMSDHVFSSLENIQRFNGLKTIILDQITSFDGLNRLNCLPNLSSLIINQSDRTTTENINWHWIISLPALKYCKIFSEDCYVSFPSSSETFNESPSMEHLVINSRCNLQKLPYLLSRFPHLRRLSIDYLYYSSDRRIRAFPKVTSKLTHVFLDLGKITFNQLEPFLAQFLPSLKVLRISTNDDEEYINASRWERLISTYMLDLRVFDMQYICRTRDDHDQLVFDDLIKQFTSPFWVQRQWYFACQHHEGNDGSSRSIFYSVKPYR